jgi:hypothetical protein
MKSLQISPAVAVLLLLNLTGWATTVVRMDLPSLVQESDSIVQGQVESVVAQWDEQKKTIFTYVSIRVREPLKGEPGQTVLIRQIGGKVGAMNLSILGMPSFRTGEEVILFLKHNPEASYHVVGLSQGKYEIASDSAIANTSGIELVDKKTGQMIEGGAVNSEPLEIFKSRIRRLVK